MKTLFNITVIGLVLLCPLLLFGQQREAGLSIYFSTNHSDIKAGAKLAIDQALDTLQVSELMNVWIRANTDNTADSLYNIHLSERRAEVVKNYLAGKGIDKSMISVACFGENKPLASNTTTEGKQINRRVDIQFSFQEKITHKQQLDTVPKAIVKTDSCKKDTTITLPEGTQLIFNLCEYHELKDCVVFTEANNARDIITNELPLIDSGGITISSCGIVRITLKPGCTYSDCFKVPVKALFPASENVECDACPFNPLYRIVFEKANSAKPGHKLKIKEVRVEGRKFYQLDIACLHSWDICDCVLDGEKIKFKINKGYHLVYVKVVYDCPIVWGEATTSKRKNIAIMHLPCRQANKTVMATVVNAKGDTLILPPQDIDRLTRRMAFSKCPRIKGETEGHWLGIFPRHKHTLYRKYIIKPSLLIKRHAWNNKI